MKPEELRQIRKQLNLTQQQLADILGVSSRQVIRWEKGDYPISKIAEVAVRGLLK
jgi:DNA-binding transcriptional regulator YiaG